jgi:hypothetical protein
MTPGRELVIHFQAPDNFVAERRASRAEQIIGVQTWDTGLRHKREDAFRDPTSKWNLVVGEGISYNVGLTTNSDCPGRRRIVELALLDGAPKHVGAKHGGQQQ